MAASYSSYVTESHGGRTRAYVKGWVDSETDATATIYVYGCAEGTNLTMYGVRTTVYVNGEQVAANTGTIFSASGTAQVAACSGKLTVPKTSASQNIAISAKISGETVDGYGPIAGSATATATVVVDAKASDPPAAPTNLAATRNAQGDIELSWTNNAENATGTRILRAKKGELWVLAYETDEVITSYTDSPGEGAYKYTVCHTNEAGPSGYSNETEYIGTICPPDPPTLVSPASGATVNAAQGTVTVKWRHNPLDASPQTAAKVYWNNASADLLVAETGEEESCELPLSGNETIYWKVATKGAHEDYGEPSALSHFVVRTPPAVTLNVPQTVSSAEIPVSWTYEDETGRQASAVLEVLDESGNVAFATRLLKDTDFTVTGRHLVLEQSRTYTVRLTATSTTTLSCEAQASVLVEYDPPARPSLAVAVNRQRAEATVTVFAGPSQEGVPRTEDIALYRDGALLMEGLCTGESYVDRTPPLDRTVEYKAVARSELGAAAERAEKALVPSGGFAFFNFGSGKVAKVGMNIRLSDQALNEKECYSVASSKYQKVFYGEHVERTGSISADAFWAHDALGYGEEAMLSAVEALRDHAGPVYLRLPHSDCFFADVDVSAERSVDAYNIASVSIDWRRSG